MRPLARGFPTVLSVLYQRFYCILGVWREYLVRGHSGITDYAIGVHIHASWCLLCVNEYYGGDSVVDLQHTTGRRE